MDFLKARTHDAIRRELRSIADSYHHFWDLLAELIQNSRDAIARAQSEGAAGPHFIRVTVDAASRLIEVLDNGVGIEESKLQEILAPGGGDKSARDGEIGEKGVGLTYTIFCGNRFEIESRSVGGSHFGGYVEGARQWLDSDDLEQAPPEYTSLPTASHKLTAATIKLGGIEFPLKTFTRVQVSAVPPPEESEDLFSLTSAQMRFVLSTRTAIGVTDTLFADQFKPTFRAFCRLDLGAGSPLVERELDVGYPAPHEYAAHSVLLEKVHEAFIGKAGHAERLKFLKDKVVWGRHETQRGGETIRVYGATMPGNAVFAQFAADPLQLISATDDQDESDDTLFRSGVFLATKGMPTGLDIQHGPGGKYPAYYRRCIFIVESNRIRFDLGRKSIHWKHKRRLQEAVSTLFKKFEAVAQYQTDSRPKPSQEAIQTETKAEREARKKKEWEAYEALVDLKLSKISYEKVPANQEAAVAAIFHELLGAGLLKHYRPLSTGYSAQYDLHALYNDPHKKQVLQLLIEFKLKLESLIKDLEDGRKYLDDIHLLVAWSADEQKLKDAGFALDEVSGVPLDGVTHELSFPIPGMDPIPVILLEDLVKKLRGA